MPTNVNVSSGIRKQPEYYALASDQGSCLVVSIRATPEEVLECPVVGKNHRLVRIPRRIMWLAYSNADGVVEFIRKQDAMKKSVMLRGV